jgi:hypothetical protein
MAKIALLMLCLLLITTAALASEPATTEENNPDTNPDANACYIGGSLFGKCSITDVNRDSQIEGWEIDYMYDAGWYLIRFDKGLFARNVIPEKYRWLLPPEPVPEDGAPVATTCRINLTGPIVGAPTTLITPLAVINGGFDPNGVPNAPYGFDWGTTGRLNVVVPGGGFVVYDLVAFGGWYAPHVASTDCPTPIPPGTP